MKILVREVPTSPYINDVELDWTEQKLAPVIDSTIKQREIEVIHLGFYCNHDCAIVEKNDVTKYWDIYCPDCPEGQGLSGADVEEILNRRG